MAREYTEEERAAAWAAYYAQQGYDPTLAAQTSTYSNNAYASTSAAPMMAAQFQQQPFIPTYDPEMAQQAQAYVPGGATGAGKSSSSSATDKDGKKPPVKYTKDGKRETVIRKSGGRVWEDRTLVDWDPSWFRLFVGDLANDMRAENLDRVFEKYPSYKKAKVVRDHLSDKAKYGFIAFGDPEDFLKAWKEYDGKYVGSRPIRLMKVRDDRYGGVAPVQIGEKKARLLDKIAKNKFKPLNGRPTPY